MIVLKHSPDSEYWYWYDTDTNYTSQPFESQEKAVEAKKEDTLEWSE